MTFRAGTARPFQILGLALVLVLALGLVVLGGRWMAAEIAVQRLQALQESWNAEDGALSVEGWKRAGALAETVQRHGNGSARHIQVLGRQHARLNASPLLEAQDPGNAEEVIAIASTAGAAHVAALREAALRRPTWPYGWLELALHKSRTLRDDDEFKQAFANAWRFGPHFEQVTRLLALMSIQHNYLVVLDPEFGATMLEVMQTALGPDNRFLREIIRTMDETQTLQVFCPVLNTERLAEEARQACMDL